MHYRIRQIVPQINCVVGKLRIHILIGVSNWTNKGKIAHVSRFWSVHIKIQRWYSVNKISNKSNGKLIHIAEGVTQF